MSGRKILKFPHCVNNRNLLSHFFNKNFVKTTFFLHKLQKYWLHEIFFQFGKKNYFTYFSYLLQQFTAVPETPLLTSKVLKEETEQWPEVQQEMSLALKEMRVDTEQTTMIKNPNNSNSALAKKRRNKAGTVPSTIAEQMSTEDSK